MSLPRPALPSRPSLHPPPGSWDCHVHVFGPRARYPLDPRRRYTPGQATVENLAMAMKRSGLSRAVLVQPSPYGADHGCLVDALSAMEGRCAGVASFPADAPLKDTTLAQLDAVGVRGLRVHALREDHAQALSSVSRGADVARELGWSIHMQIAAGQLELAEKLAGEVDVAIVLDHLAYVRPVDLGRLLALLNNRDIFVKISALYRQPNRTAAIEAARVLLAQAPEQCLWGSDWPHTPPHPANVEAAKRVASFRKIDFARDFDAVFRGTSQQTLRTVLCQTPARLYDRETSPVGRKERAQ